MCIPGKTILLFAILSDVLVNHGQKALYHKVILSVDVLFLKLPAWKNENWFLCVCVFSFLFLFFS